MHLNHNSKFRECQNCDALMHSHCIKDTIIKKHFWCVKCEDFLSDLPDKDLQDTFEESDQNNFESEKNITVVSRDLQTHAHPDIGRIKEVWQCFW